MASTGGPSAQSRKRGQLMGWAASDLVAALRRQVTELETDLRQRVDGEDHHARQAGVFQAWESDYDAARAAQRTAATWSQWRDDRVTQAAVAWVLLTVFARYCEDNALVGPRWIAGADADQRGRGPGCPPRLLPSPPRAHRPGMAGPDHRPLRRLLRPPPPWSTASRRCTWSPRPVTPPERCWSSGGSRTTTANPGLRLHRHRHPLPRRRSTRTSPSTPRRPTPCCRPRSSSRSSSSTTPWNPPSPTGHWRASPSSTPPAAQGTSCSGRSTACTDRWQRHAPGLGARELVAKALDSVYGVDINPFAVAIARFRLAGGRPARRRGHQHRTEDRLHPAPRRRRQPALGCTAAGPRRRPAHRSARPSGRIATENTAALKEILHRPPRRRGRQPALHHPEGRRSSTRTYRTAVPHLPPPVRAHRSVHGTASSTSPIRPARTGPRAGSGRSPRTRS